MQHVVFEIGKHVFRAQLNDKTPNICRLLLSRLPVITSAVHAKFAGDEIITMVPFYADPENEILNVTAGDIGYYPGRQTFCLFYGDVKPFGAVSVFASIENPLEPVRAAAREILKSNSLPVVIRAEDSTRASNVAEVSPGIGSEDQPPGFVCEYWKKAWLSTPEDLLRLQQTHRPPSGTMPCILYACFNLFWLGEELQILRRLVYQQNDQDKVLNSNRQMVEALLRHHAMRLEKWGMTDTSVFLRQFADFVADRALEIKPLLSALEMSWIALNRMQSHIDAKIPWNTLDEHERALAGSASPDVSRPDQSYQISPR